MILFIYRGCERIFDRPAVFNTRVDRSARNSCIFFPVFKRLRFSAKCDMPIISAISLLFFLCSPSTVLFTIMPVIINSIQRMFWRWSIAHILVKILELVPTLTDFNPTPTVKGVSDIILIFATIYHCSPSAIYFCVRHSVCYVYFLDTINLITAAACRLFATKIATSYNAFCTAVTSAQPIKYAVFFARYFFNNDKSTIAATRTIYAWATVFYNLCFSHWTILLNRFVLRLGSRTRYSASSIRFSYNIVEA